MTSIIRYLWNVIRAIGAFFSGNTAAANVTVIGGADGPTSVFLAGKVSHISILGIGVIGIAVLIVIILAVWKIKRGKYHESE